MNKTLFFIFIISLIELVFITDIIAQERYFGLKAGANAYNLITEASGSETTSDPKLGLEAGIFGDFPINRILSIQPEVVYVRKGGKEGNESPGASSLTLKYVDVPVVIKINAPISENFEPYIFGGPYAAYLIDATSESKRNSRNITEQLHEFNYGAKVGLGINIASLVIDARYDMGVADLFVEDDEVSEEDFKLTTTGIVISVGITF